MNDTRQSLDYATLRKLVPFDQVPPHRLGEVMGQFTVQQLLPGQCLLRQGDRDNQTIYLIKGKLDLLADNKVVATLTAGTEAARQPIAHQQPRPVSVTAKTKAVVARIDSALLDFLLTSDQSNQYEITEIEAAVDGGWLTRILQSKVLLKLPTANIQTMLSHMEPVEVHAGDTIVREGDEGDYYYIIRHGRCRVTRKDPAGNDIILAELQEGDGFGEEALLSGRRRNATLTMTTDGMLMRLPRQDFLDLLITPLLTRVNYEEAVKLEKQGATWLDVRSAEEYRRVHIEGSHNMPLSELRDRVATLDPAQRYIVCSNTGRHAATAAFLLSERGFDVYVLTGGLQSVPPRRLKVSARAAEPETPATAGAAAAGGVEVIHFWKPTAPDAASGSEPSQTPDVELQRLRSELEAVRKRSEAEIARLKNQTKAYAEKIEREAAAAIEQAQDASREAERKAGELDAALRQARAEITALQAQAAEHTALRQTFEAEQRQRADELERLRAELVSLQGRLEQTERSAAAADQARRTLEAEAGALRAALEDAGKEHAELARLRSEVSALKAEQQKARAQASALRQENEHLNTELSGLAQARHEAEQEAARLRAELDDVRRSGDALLRQTKDEVAALEAELESVQAQVKALAEQKRSAEDAAAAGAAEAARLKTELEQAQREREAALAQASAEITALQAELGKAQAQAKALEEQRQRTAQEAEHARMELEAAQKAHTAAINQLVTEVSDLETRLRDAQAQIAVLEAEKNAAVAQSPAADEELARLRAGFEEALEERDTRIAGLTAEVAALQNALHDAQSEIGTLQAALEAARAEATAAAQQELAALQRSLDAARQEHDATLERHRTEMAQLRVELQQVQAQANVLEEQKRQAEATARSAAAETARLQATLDVLKARADAELALARERIIALEARQHDEAPARATLEAEVSELRARLEAALREAQSQAERFAAERERLEQETAQERARLAQAQAAAERLAEQESQRRQQIEAAHAAAQQAIAALEAELHAAREQERSRRDRDADEAVRLREELERLKEEHLQLDIARREAEATAISLREALAQAKQLAEEETQRRIRAEEDVAMLRTEIEYSRALAQPQPSTTNTVFEPALPRALPPPATSKNAPGYKRRWNTRPALLRSAGVIAVLIVIVAATLAFAFFGERLGQYLSPTAVSEQKPPPHKPAAPSTKSTANKRSVTAGPKRISPLSTFHDTLQDGSPGPVMIGLPAGTFVMGAGAGSPHFDERPQRTVKVGRFAIGKYEVTFDEYKAFAQATGREIPHDQGWGGGTHPVVNVTWKDATAYAEWLSEQTGHHYRLPSEAEWEYAARAGSVGLYWWGSDSAQGRAVCFDCGSRWDGQQTAPVGSLAGNAFGLHDTAGNVEEWVQDCYHPNYEGAPANARPRLDGDCTQRVARGGSYRNTKADLRVSRRVPYPADTRLDTLGFRLVREY